jgi:hypothetical protein
MKAITLTCHLYNQYDKIYDNVVIDTKYKLTQPIWRLALCVFKEGKSIERSGEKTELQNWRLKKNTAFEYCCCCRLSSQILIT